jgi:hypothetical protein
MSLNLISLYIVAAMVGIMVFFTIAVAPTVFKVLPAEWSSKYVRSFFPKVLRLYVLRLHCCLLVSERCAD